MLDLKFLHSAAGSKGGITKLKLSPNGKLIAATAYGLIFVVDCSSVLPTASSVIQNNDKPKLVMQITAHKQQLQPPQT